MVVDEVVPVLEDFAQLAVAPEFPLYAIIPYCPTAMTFVPSSEHAIALNEVVKNVNKSGSPKSVL
jgi:hypothetical protein